MTGILELFDATLALTLVGIAVGVLFARDLFQSIVLFIAFGLLLAIAWCRLQAVDLALAEAAIGAGLTGALFLNALASTKQNSDDRDTLNQQTGHRPSKPALERLPARGIPRWAAPLTFLLAVGLVAAWLISIVAPLANPSVAPQIAEDKGIIQGGVTNPVTAVLLNFRAHDTLLEVVVLLVAVLATLAFAVSTERERSASPASPVLASFVALIVPLMVLVAAYVLWIGTKAPGGAFQAAALLAATGVLIMVAGGRPPSCALLRWRIVLVVGLATFLAVALGGMLGGRFLEYPPSWAGGLILLIEATLTVSIAGILITLFGATWSAGDPGAASHAGDTLATPTTDPSGNTP